MRIKEDIFPSHPYKMTGGGGMMTAKEGSCMKLNAEIVYRELSKRYRAEFFPNGDDALTLSGPEFYMDDEQNFPEGRLYLAEKAGKRFVSAWSASGTASTWATTRNG